MPFVTDTSSVSVQLRKPSCFVSRRLPPAPADRNTPLSSIAIASGSPIRQALRSSAHSGGQNGSKGRLAFRSASRTIPGPTRTRRMSNDGLTPVFSTFSAAGSREISGDGPGSGRGLSRSGDEGSGAGALDDRDRWGARSGRRFLGRDDMGRFLGSGGFWRRRGGLGDRLCDDDSVVRRMRCDRAIGRRVHVPPAGVRRRSSRRARGSPAAPHGDRGPDPRPAASRGFGRGRPCSREGVRLSEVDHPQRRDGRRRPAFLVGCGSRNAVRPGARRVAADPSVTSTFPAGGAPVTRAATATASPALKNGFKALATSIGV